MPDLTEVDWPLSPTAAILEARKGSAGESLIAKADAGESTIGDRYVPTTDPHRTKVGGNLRPTADSQQYRDNMLSSQISYNSAARRQGLAPNVAAYSFFRHLEFSSL